MPSGDLMILKITNQMEFDWGAYPALISVSRGYSGEKGTFPRVTHPSAADGRSHPLDLHVLSLPPAFVLSQDQTLKLKSAIRSENPGAS
jgi:hypothetical protein